MSPAIFNAIVTSLLTIEGGLCVALLLEKFKVTKIRETKFLDKYFETIEGIGEHLSEIDEAFGVFTAHSDTRGEPELYKEKRFNVYAHLNRFKHYGHSRRVYLTPKINACIEDINAKIFSLIHNWSMKKAETFNHDYAMLDASIKSLYDELYAEILPLKPKHWQNQGLTNVLDALKKERDTMKAEVE